MDIYLIIFFIIGLVLGSFYNVVGLRLPKKESIIFPSSHCVKCNHKLKWYELIPVISYIFLKGRCKNCKEKISIMYPVVELFTGILFALSYYSFGLNLSIIPALLTSSIFSIIVVSDLNYYIISDSIIVIYGILMFIYNIIAKGFLNACTYALYGFIMFIFMYLLMKFGNYIFKEESLGGGDIKLMGVLGQLFNPFMSFFSLALGSLIAIPSSLFFNIKKKDKTIPFGPFIVAGFLIMMFSKLNFNEILDYFTIVK